MICSIIRKYSYAKTIISNAIQMQVLASHYDFRLLYVNTIAKQ